MTASHENDSLPISHGLATAVLRGKLLKEVGASGAKLRAAQDDPATLAAAQAAYSLAVTNSAEGRKLTDQEARERLASEGVTLCQR